jgi:CubicO group peptidase (beta-lactamase class C family)
MDGIGGTVEPGYEALREAFAEGQAADEGGAQLCIYRHGKKVVDLWCGRDKVNNRPYTDQTITVLMSCSKGAVATAAHMLAERGLLDLDAPVTKYWPEFGQAGKKDVPVSYLLSHKGGIFVKSGIGAEPLDRNKSTAAMAATQVSDAFYPITR